MPGNFNLPPLTVFSTWPTPNYVDPVERRWLGAYSIVWAVASSLLTFGRFYLRARKQAGTFGFDDVLILFAWLFGLGLSILGCIGSERGLGRHTWDIPIIEYPTLIEIGYFAQVFFLISMCTTKLSVLLFYRRMVKDTYSQKWLYIIWAAITCNVSAGVATFIVYMNICHPLDSYWKAYQYVPVPYTESYSCVAHGKSLTLSSGIISIITDIYAVLIPWFMMRQYRLDVPRRQKIALNTIFALGWFATGCGVARTYYLYRMDEVTDLSWTGFNLLAWSLAETHIGIVCACAPSLRAFFRKYVSLSSHRNSQRISRRLTADGGEDALAGGSTPNRFSARSIFPLKEMKSESRDSMTPPSPVVCRDEKEAEMTVYETSSTSSGHTSKERASVSQ